MLQYPVVRFGVVVFPGSNCDRDCADLVERVLRRPVEWVWHKATRLPSLEVLILPGGFSYGDYLRCGALARFSPVMPAVEAFAKAGGLVIGICNGFQILLEAGLLPGAMRRNAGMQFVCRDVYVRVEQTATPWTSRCRPGQVLKMPIAHGEGNYYAPPEVVSAMTARGQVLLRYCTPDGRITPEANPNGSAEQIAGIVNEAKNVFGLMPHPERSAEALLGSADGLAIFESVLTAVARA